MAFKKGEPRLATAGRKKGSQNKVPKTIKESILAAFDAVGAEEYLIEQAHANPTAFLNLMGKILPSELSAKVEGAVSLNIQWNE